MLIDQTHDSRPEPGPQFGSLMNRYTDAYRKAHFIDRLGSILKKIGIGAGVLIFVIGMTALSSLFSSLYLLVRARWAGWAGCLLSALAYSHGFASLWRER